MRRAPVFFRESLLVLGTPPTQRLSRTCLCKSEMISANDSWFRRRKYLHFDLPKSLAQARTVVTNPDRVKEHAFYPFIYSVITTVKLSKDPTTHKIERKLKEREIAYASHLDSHIYAYYASRLDSLYEKRLHAQGLGSCILAFRKLGKSNIDFAMEAFEVIAKRGDCVAIAFDIKGFFDNLDHLRLKHAWSDIIGSNRLPLDHYNVYRSLTHWCRVDKSKLYKALGISIHNPHPRSVSRHRLCTPEEFRSKVREADLLEVNQQQKGIPQGSPISAILSNIYMLGFDAQMNSFAHSVGACYFRYCDDMMLIGPSNKLLPMKTFVETSIAGVGLEVQQEKTEIREFFSNEQGQVTSNKPLQYLGFLFDGRRIHIRSSSMMRYLDRMRKGISIAKKCARKINVRRQARGENSKPLHLKLIYTRYSYLGRRNFLSYGYRAATAMASQPIRRQLKPLWRKLKGKLES